MTLRPTCSLSSARWRVARGTPRGLLSLPSLRHRLGQLLGSPCATVKDRIPALKAAGVGFFFLPPYSPELNMVEPLWRQIKHQDIPYRSYLTIEARSK